MRRMRVVGLCLVAVFALGAMLAASAQAKKSTPITGPFKVTSTTGEALLKAAVMGNVKCKHGEDVGEITGPKVGTDTVTFFECEGFGFKCHSEGEPSGTIKTFLLDTELGWISKAKGEVGIDLKSGEAGKEPYLAEFDCEGLKAKVKGSVIGLLGPVNHMGITETQTFTGEGFVQEIQNLEGMGKDTLITETSKTGSQELESAQNAVGTTTNEEVEVKGKKGKVEKKADPAEIDTVSGTPEYGRCQAKKNGKYADGNCQTKVSKKGKYEWEPIS